MLGKFLHKDYHVSGQAKKKQHNVESLSTIRNHDQDRRRRQKNDLFPHMSPSGFPIAHLRLLISLGQSFPLDWPSVKYFEAVLSSSFFF